MTAQISEADLREMLRGADVEALVQGMTPAERLSLLEAWDLWARPHQRMPLGKWRRWICRGGRGSGKSTTGSNTLHKVARDKRSLGTGTIGIVGRTHDDVRITTVCDPATGILATAPRNFKPQWQPGPGILTWPNGVRARVFSGDAPEAIRGNNFAFLWAEELQSWPNAEETWHTIVEPAVRIARAQILITMTPKPLRWLRELEAMEGSVRTGARMYDNIFLDREFLSAIERAYVGTPLEKQEIGGDYIEQVRGALCSLEKIAANRVPFAPRDFTKIVVAVDPAVTNTEQSDETGVIVYGVTAHDHGYPLADESGKFDIVNGEWAEHVVDVFRRWQASMVVAEVNNGGDFVEAGLRAIDKSIPYSKVTASRGKMIRAEPIGALYKTNRIHHVGDGRLWQPLEDELTTWIPGEGKSPNRLDALVWAATFCHITETEPQGSSCANLLGNRRR